MWVVYAVRNDEKTGFTQKFRQEFRTAEAAQDICKDLYMDGYDKIGIKPPYRRTDQRFDNRRHTQQK